MVIMLPVGSWFIARDNVGFLSLSVSAAHRKLPVAKMPTSSGIWSRSKAMGMLLHYQCAQKREMESMSGAIHLLLPAKRKEIQVA